MNDGLYFHLSNTTFCVPAYELLTRKYTGIIFY